MRGEIQNRERAKQLRDFTGLKWGNITPTDIDGFVEFRDKLHVYMEFKVSDTKLQEGQRKALERACDAATTPERQAVALILEHDTPPEQDIDCAACPVREYRYQREWREPVNPITCKEAIDVLLGKVGLIL